MSEKVANLAASSRIIILGLQFISDLIIPDHNPGDDVFRSPRITSDNNVEENTFLDGIVKFLFGGLLRWDAEYFLHIAEHGYTYENTLAFYPTFPGIVHLVTKCIMAIFSSLISFRYAALLVAVLLNVYFFRRAARCLYEMSLKVFGDPTMAWNAVILFCFNPASIFFTAPYSESLFCWLSFSLMLECLLRRNVFHATAALALSMTCRANGLLSIGFPLYFVCREVLVRKTMSKILKLFVIIIPSLIPLVSFNFYAQKLFCQETKDIELPPRIVMYGQQQGYVLPGAARNESVNFSPWCEQRLPYPYSYVQQHYWNVGFLQYYQLKQIPNFLLAAPILSFILVAGFKSLFKIFKVFREKGFIGGVRIAKSLPFIVHALFLTIFCIFFVHIQISTRLLASASPCLYWFGSDYMPKNFDNLKFSFPRAKSRRAAIIYWFGGYFVVGTLLFTNFYPWT